MSAASRRAKREAPVTVHMPPPLKTAVRQVARREDRSVSMWLVRLAEKEPSVQIVLQQIEGPLANH